jgi:hypothetical protein
VLIVLVDYCSISEHSNSMICIIIDIIHCLFILILIFHFLGIKSNLQVYLNFCPK